MSGAPYGWRNSLPDPRYGWRNSLPDPRNKPTLVPNVAICNEVDPREWLPPCYNQYQIGSCTANATAAAFRAAYIKADKDPGDFSRLWIYFRERLFEGTPAQDDSGAEGHTAYKVARKIGLALESDWPYAEGAGFAGPSPGGAMTDAANYKVPSYSHPAQDEEVFRRLLSNDQLITFGFSVAASFESETVARSGFYDPQPGESIVGGHEVCLVGYIPVNTVSGPATTYPLFRNSWGTAWGMHGYFCAPWSFVLGSACTDFRTVDPF